MRAITQPIPCESDFRPCYISLFGNTVSAGFPSPADDYIEQKLDLSEHLIQHPSATFFVRARGQSMVGAGIHDGDLLIVDRALEASDGKVVIAIINGELTVKRLRKRNGKTFLCPENPIYHPIEIHADMEARVWGVVIHSIHQV